MFFRTGAMAVALSVAIATTAVAQPSMSLDTRGRVVRVDAPYNVLVLDDGRMYRITPGSMVLLNGQAVPIAALQPGSVVVIRSGEAVTIRDGQYVGAAPTAPVDVVGSAPAPAPAVAVPGTVVATAPMVKRTIYGKVTDVDKDGDVTVKTDGGEFEIRLTPDTVRQIRKGDAVMIDATFAPPGTPAR